MIFIRKASAHGLGHLRAPFDEVKQPADIPPPAGSLSDIDVEYWQYCLWHQIVAAALKGPLERPDYWGLPGFDQSAVARCAITTPHLAKGFRRYNRGKPYRQQARPFNFMLTFLPDRCSEPPIKILSVSRTGALQARKIKFGRERVLAPYHEDLSLAIANAFDRDTGKPVPAFRLKTNRRVLGSYHLHPEAKFENGDWSDFGPTKRRVIQVTGIHHIGKEAHRWEEEFFLGHAPDTRLEFGITPSDQRHARIEVTQLAKEFSRSAIARTAGMSRQHFTAWLNGKSTLGQDRLIKLQQAATSLRTVGTEVETILVKIRTYRKCIPERRMAELADMDPGHFHRLVNGERHPTSATLAKLKKAIAFYETSNNAELGSKRT